MADLAALRARLSAGPLQAVVERPSALWLVGPDARRFCNGMFTNNARDLAVGAGQRSAMLDDRGRVVGLMDLFCAADDRFLVVPDGMSVDAFTERYSAFIVFDDVEIVPYPVPDARVVVGVHTVAQLPDHPPAPVPWGIAAVNGVTALRRPGELELWGAPPVPGVAEIHPADLELLRVAAGRVRWPDDVGPKRLAHELGLRDAALHFAKGCYVGQETVNRVDVMGEVKRGLFGLDVAGHGVPTGAAVHGADGALLGELTSPVPYRDGDRDRTLALAVLRRPPAAPGMELEVRHGDGRWPAVVRDLPR